MRLLGPITALLATAATAATAGVATKSVTVYAWPFAASKPQSLATIEYELENYTATVAQYTPPPPKDGEDLVRIGLYNAKTAAWNGVVAATSSFNDTYQGKMFLHLDAADDVHRVSFGAFARPLSAEQRKELEREQRRTEKRLKKGLPIVNKKSKKAKGEVDSDAKLIVQVVRPTPPPSPHLNKPVLLTADGKVPHKEEEKSFFQKYWWAIALFVVMQIVSSATGGGEEGEGGAKKK